MIIIETSTYPLRFFIKIIAKKYNFYFVYYTISNVIFEWRTIKRRVFPHKLGKNIKTKTNASITTDIEEIIANSRIILE